MSRLLLLLTLLPTLPAADSAKVLEILQSRCSSCHGAAAMSGLDLRTREGLLKGGAQGAAVQPGNKDASLLYQALLRTGKLQMPPGKVGLTADEVDAIGEWIEAGAPWTGRVTSNAAPSWWSFKPVRKPSVPKIPGVTNPIDAFIRAALQAKGLKQVAPASKQTLVRRAYFDLWGIPPTPEQAADFLKDESPNAWERLIDKLLASPRYGERWGRYWLDVARYADTGGFEHDMYFPNAWRYRDYVIKSLNEDKPYSQFVQEQIAADEIWPDNLDLDGTYELPKEKQRHIDARIGTGFYTIGPWYPASAIVPESLRADRLADMVDTTAAAFMGLTFGCARCHDHKFDPIPQRDYYRLAAIFAASEEREIPIVDLAKLVDFQKHMTRVVAMDDLRSAVRQLDSEKKKRKLTDTEIERRESLVRRIGEMYLEFPGRYPTANVLAHLEQVPDTHILVRGEYQKKGAKVNAGLPTFAGDAPEIPSPSGGQYSPTNRKFLAEWLTSKDHPLTWRVIVNRVWQSHFGHGLVRTPNDFGRQGETPTHPELLDWLAATFVENGTSLKSLHKLILLSDTWRLGNAADSANLAADPENKLLWRMNRRRIEAEALRDSVLSVSGRLNLTMYGPPVAPPLSAEEMQGIKETYMWPATVDPNKASRRSVYLYVKRSFPMPLFSIFDVNDPSQSCARRESTNVAPQALALLNNSFLSDQASSLAARLTKESGGDSGRLVDRAWHLALSRSPSAEERSRAMRMLDSGPKALERFCLMLFNLNEFLYVD